MEKATLPRSGMPGRTGDSSNGGGNGDGKPPGGIDWKAAAQSQEFGELVTKRRSFVVPATIGFLGWYLAFILLAGYAPDFMGESIYEGLTVGYVLAFSQFLMVWGLTWAYIRRADRVFDPLAKRAAQKALAEKEARDR